MSSQQHAHRRSALLNVDLKRFLQQLVTIKSPTRKPKQTTWTGSRSAVVCWSTAVMDAIYDSDEHTSVIADL